MAQFVKCSTCGKPYLDKGGSVCPHCARAGRPVTPSPVAAPHAPAAAPAAAPKVPTPAPPAVRTPAPPAPAPAASAPAESAVPAPAPAASAPAAPPAPAPARAPFASAATIIAIPSAMAPPVAPAPAREPEAVPAAAKVAPEVASPAPPAEPLAAVPPTMVAPPAPAPFAVAPVPVPPASPMPAEIPVSAKTLIFAPIAPPPAAPPPAAVTAQPAAPPPAAAPPVAAEARPRHDTPAAVYAGMRQPEIGQPPTAQAGQMNVRPLRPTPVVGMPVKVVARGAEPTDLASLAAPAGANRRPTSDVIGAPRPADPSDKRDPRQKPAHAEGVRVVLPDAPVLEVGRDAVAPVSDRPAERTGEIKALRVRLTQELAVVKPTEPNAKKIVAIAALAGMLIAFVLWWIIG